MAKVLSQFPIWKVVLFGTTEVDLVSVSPRELGLTGRLIRDKEICEGGVAQGLQLCSPELVHQLRLQHLKPGPNNLRIAMDEIVIDTSISYLITALLASGRRRRTSGGFREADERIVFIQPRH